MEERLQFIEDNFESLGFDLSELQCRQFFRFYELLVEKNKVMNLTGITEFDEVVVKHFVDSCMLKVAVDSGLVSLKGKKLSMVDVGTGAGFPGVPLKIVYPELDLTLLDSLNKRILFLEEVGAAIDLDKVHYEHGRAEDFAKNHREIYDLSVSRAVANLALLSEYCLPFVKVGGCFVSYKSGDIDEELKQAEKAIQVLGGRVKGIERFTLSDGSTRSLIVIEKVEKTPAMYPRKAGKAEKSPIK